MALFCLQGYLGGVNWHQSQTGTLSNWRRIMKTTSVVLLNLAAVAALGFCPGCSTQSSLTSPYHPGPVAGKAVGTGVGVVAGNVVGAGVGAGEGLVQGAAAPFNPTARVVRRWKYETTSDGRTIQVPEDILVDADGRPVKMPAPR